MSPAASREYHAFSAPRWRRSSMWTEMLHPQLWICVRMSIAAKFVVQDQSRLFLDLFVFHSLIYQKNHHFLYVSFLAPSRGSFVVCEYLWYDSLIALWLSSIIRYVNRSCIPWLRIWIYLKPSMSNLGKYLSSTPTCLPFLLGTRASIVKLILIEPTSVQRCGVRKHPILSAWPIDKWTNGSLIN